MLNKKTLNVLKKLDVSEIIADTPEDDGTAFGLVSLKGYLSVKDKDKLFKIGLRPCNPEPIKIEEEDHSSFSGYPSFISLNPYRIEGEFKVTIQCAQKKEIEKLKKENECLKAYLRDQGFIICAEDD